MGTDDKYQTTDSIAAFSGRNPDWMPVTVPEKRLGLSSDEQTQNTSHNSCS